MLWYDLTGINSLYKNNKIKVWYYVEKLLMSNLPLNDYELNRLAKGVWNDVIAFIGVCGNPSHAGG